MTSFGSVAAAALKARLPWCRFDARGETLVAALPPPAIDHLQRSAGRSLRRARRRGSDISIVVHDSPEDIAPALERMFRLYRLVWSGRSGEIGRFAHCGAQRAAYRAAVHALANAERVRLVEVTENGRPIAAQLGLLAGRGALAHTTALTRNTQVHGAGHIALLAWIEEAIRSGAESMDLSRGGNEPGGPKARLRPDAAQWGTITAARQRNLQHAFEAVLHVRHQVRHGAASWRSPG
jgi:hypothetical protein